MTTTKTCATLATNRINFVDEDNTWRILFRLCKKITYTRCTNTYEHFYEIRTGNRKEWNSRFSGNCLRKQCLTGSRRTYQQHAFRDSCSHLDIFLRRFQEINNLLQFLFLFFQTCHLSKCHFLVTVCTQSCTALSKIHCFRIRTAALPVHQTEEQENSAQCKNNRQKCGCCPAVLRDIRHRILHILFFQIILDLVNIRNIQISDLIGIVVSLQRNLYTSRRNTLILIHFYRLDLVILNQLLEILPGNLFFSLIELIGKPQCCEQKYDKHEEYNTIQPSRFLIIQFSGSFLVTRLFYALYHSDKRKVSISLSVIQTISHNKFVRDIESDIIYFYIFYSSFRFVQKRTKLHTLWISLSQDIHQII